MFYESQRIINKQTKYEKSRAYNIIDELRKRGFNHDSILKILDALVHCAKSETDIAIFKKAKSISVAEKEKSDE
jgi:hypothetical protein